MSFSDRYFKEKGKQNKTVEQKSTGKPSFSERYAAKKQELSTKTEGFSIAEPTKVNKPNLAILNRVTAEDKKKIESLDKKEEKSSSILTRPLDNIKTILKGSVFNETPEEARKNLESNVKTKLGAAALGVTDAATLGLNKRIVDKVTKGNNNLSSLVLGDVRKSPYEIAKESQPGAYITGEIAGSIAPWSAAEGLVKTAAKPILKKVGSELGKRVIIGGGAGALTGGVQSAIEGNNAKKIATDSAVGGVVGGAGEVLIGALGKVAKKAFSKIKTGEPLTQAEQAAVKEVEPSLIDKIRQDFGITEEGFYRAVNPIDDKDMSLINKVRSSVGMEEKTLPINKDMSLLDLTRDTLGLSKRHSVFVENPKVHNTPLRPAPLNANNTGNVNLQTFAGTQHSVNMPQGTGNIDTARAKFNFKPTKEKINIGETITKLRTQLVDKYAPLEKLEKNIRGKVSSAESSLYKQARLFEGIPERANVIIDKELKPIIKSVENKGYSYKDLGMYAEAVHAKDVNAAGINSGFTNAEIDDIIAKLGTPEMETARKQLVEYSRNRLKDLTRSQIISRESYLNMTDKWENYIPLARSFDDDKVEFAAGLSKAFANVTSPIKALKGSDRQVIDPIESLIKNTYQIESAAGRNKVGLQLSKLSTEDATNQFIRRLNPGEEVGRKNVVNIKENGQNVSYEVEPEVYKAMLDMNKESSNALIKLMSKPASVLRAGATLTPEFALRNPIRDAMNAFIVSKSGFNPFTDFAVGLGSYIKKGEYYEAFLRNNGGYGNIISMDRQAHREALERVIKQPISKKVVNVVNPKSWVALMRTISDATESATKIGEFRAAVKKAKVSPQEAAYRARDLMDFARVGSSIKEANKVVAFLNANIQGKSKFIRAIKENPVKVTTKLATTMAIPSMAIYALNSNMASDEQKATIKDAPAWLKNSFWLVAVPGTDVVARIPKPFEGAAVSNTVERFLDYVLDNDKEAFDGFLKETIQQQSIPVMMNAITPFMEGAANYSFFRQAPIIPEREKNLLPKDQYDIYTSEISKKVAGLVEKVAPNSNFASPRIIENTIKGSTGGLGTYVLEGTDALLGKNKPAKNLTQFPVIKGFAVNDKSTGKAVEFIYNEKERLTKERGSTKLKDKLAKYQDEAKYKYINKISDQMGDISKEIRAIQDDAKLTPEQKRDKINVLADKRNKVARDAEKEYKGRKW